MCRWCSARPATTALHEPAIAAGRHYYIRTQHIACDRQVHALSLTIDRQRWLAVAGSSKCVCQNGHEQQQAAVCEWLRVAPRQRCAAGSRDILRWRVPQDAASAGDAKALNKLLPKAHLEALNTPFPAAVDPSRGTALHAAAAHGHVGAVTSLLQRGAKPNIVDAAGCTPLHLAILHRHEDCVGQLLVSLLASGAVRASARRLDLGSPATAFEAASGEGVQDASTTPCTPFYSMADNMGNVPLLLAAEMNLPSTLGLLLDAGAPPDTDRHPFTGDTALHIAAEQGNEQCLRILLERGASPAIANESGQVPLHRAAAAAPAPEGATAQGRQGHFGECVTALLEADAGSAVAKNNSSATPVDVACRCDAGRDVPGAAAAALVASASLEALSGPSHQNSGTALHSAVFHGRAGILQALLDRGVPPDSRSGLGDSALHLAAERGAAALIPLLAHAHANVNIQGLKHKKATPLHIAAKGDQVQALQALLAAGAAVDATDRDGSTALHYAAAAGARRALRVLLTDGQADPEIENLAGHTALHFARKLRSKPCIAMLTDPSSVTPFGRAGGDAAAQ